MVLSKSVAPKQKKRLTDFPAFRQRLVSLEEARTGKSLNISVMARFLGISRKSLQLWLSGKAVGADTVFTLPAAEHLVKIADAYSVSIDFLLGRTPFRTINAEEVHRITGLSDDSIRWLALEKASTAEEGGSVYHSLEMVNILLSANYGKLLLAQLFNYLSGDFRSDQPADFMAPSGNVVRITGADIRTLFRQQASESLTRLADEIQKKA